MTVRKPFSRALYEAYDGKAKAALIALLEERGHTIVNTEENYFVDVVSEKNGYTYFNEAEVKTGWKGDWPETWYDIRIPERKQRLLDKHGKENGVLNFYIFSNDMTKAWRIKDTLLTRERCLPAKGRYIRAGELFFHVPYKEAELINVA